MKDYSLFYKKPAGFITNYKIENKEILVYTAKTKKGEPHRYPATEQWINHFEERLMNQYIEIIKHQDQIIEYNKKRKSILYKALFGTFLALYLISLIFTNGPTIAGTVLAITSYAITHSIFKLIAKKQEKKFKSELKEYEQYINEREEIEKRLTKDKNITSYLSEKTQSEIKEREQQKNNGKVSEILDISFMDRTPIKDLSKMYEKYEISRSLEDSQTFYIPNNETKPSKTKKRTLKP